MSARSNLVAAAVLSIGATPAWAYECTRTAIDAGPSLTWSTRTVRWVLDAALTADIPDASVAQAAIVDSYRAWSDVPCSDFVFELAEVRAGVGASAPEGGPYENVVVFVKDHWAYDKEIIALTTAVFDDRSGKLLDADIEINDLHFEFYAEGQQCVPARGRMDLQNTITHEVGHVLGLDHPPLVPQWEEDTMYASAPPCETAKRTLAADDMAGLCAIYPAAADTQPCFPPDGPEFQVVASDDGLGCSAISGEGVTALWALGLVAWWRRRR